MQSRLGPSVKRKRLADTVMGSLSGPPDDMRAIGNPLHSAVIGSLVACVRSKAVLGRNKYFAAHMRAGGRAGSGPARFRNRRSLADGERCAALFADMAGGIRVGSRASKR